VSLATIIMISSLLKDSSDGFGRSIRTNDQRDYIQDTRSNHNQVNSQGILQDRLDTRRKGESNNHYHDFVPAKGLFRWLCTQGTFTQLRPLFTVHFSGKF
jgi:hypothetical protein